MVLIPTARSLGSYVPDEVAHPIEVRARQRPATAKMKGFAMRCERE
jgi:hypothetical protein